MASQPPANPMPLLYNALEPLSTQTHANWKTRGADEAPFLSKVHAVPITIDEFIHVQRYYPIIFSVGERSIPLALMGMNEGVNVFVDEKGKLLQPVYVPAYIRRYPFLLARLEQGSDNLSLCFDPSSNLVGEFDEGNPLFDDGKPSQTTEAIMKFCEEFEMAAQRTTAFMDELAKAELLIDGEVTIQASDNSPPAVYRGFRMVDEAKFREVRGDELRKMNQNGMLPLIVAHLFSLPLARDLYLRQIEQGKGPQPQPAPAPAEAAADA